MHYKKTYFDNFFMTSHKMISSLFWVIFSGPELTLPQSHTLPKFHSYWMAKKLIKKFSCVWVDKKEVGSRYFFCKVPLPFSQPVCVEYAKSLFLFSDGFVLLWKKGKDIVAVGSQLIDKADTRVKLEETTNGNTLVISLAEPSDAGEYSCQISAQSQVDLRHSVRIRGKHYL